jgi:hypothetical protein
MFVLRHMKQQIRGSVVEEGSRCTHTTRDAVAHDEVGVIRAKKAK